MNPSPGSTFKYEFTHYREEPQVRRAIDHGANIIGYLHWSFMDNYEWQEGFKPEGKFGLFRINYHENNPIRNHTTGGQALEFIIKGITNGE